MTGNRCTSATIAKPPRPPDSQAVFIRRKQSRNRKTFQLIQSYRKEGKVRQRVIIDLGRDNCVEGAIADCQVRIEWLMLKMEEDRKFLQNFTSEPVRPQDSIRFYPYLMQARRYWIHRDSIAKYEKRLAQQQERLERLQTVAQEVGIDSQTLEDAYKRKHAAMLEYEAEMKRWADGLRSLINGGL